MTPERWQQIQAVFGTVLQRDPAERDKYLEQACANDSDLRAQVADLLDHDAQAAHEDFLPPPDPYRPLATTAATPSADPPAPAHPESIGRYKVVGVLGKGGFGQVYLAHDDQLNRPVAIKIPHRHEHSQPQDAAAYQKEARILASLDHPNIVPVYDSGITGEALCYIVSKFIEGSDMGKRMKECPFSPVESARLLAIVADALHYAHLRGLVHRDVKPGNILIDTIGRPYVADFGLALKEDDFGKAASSGGTPAYMSPEQARGQGDRVDGRSDIFSLGVVFYELLTGRLPFRGDTRAAILEQVTTVDLRPPRQIEDTIPKELERICLKALAKQPVDRYTTAKDLADDLRQFLARGSEHLNSARANDVTEEQAALKTRSVDPMSTSPSEQPPVKVIPKRLRSLTADEASKKELPDSLLTRMPVRRRWLVCAFSSITLLAAILGIWSVSHLLNQSGTDISVPAPPPAEPFPFRLAAPTFVAGPEVYINGYIFPWWRDKIKHFVFDWGDGEPTRSGLNAGHVYAKTGKYRVRVTFIAKNDTEYPRETSVEISSLASTYPRPNWHRLSLSPPELSGMEVTVRGFVGGPCTRIGFDWGDGQLADHYFPATHLYQKPGDYEIAVTVLDSEGRRTSKTVKVTVAP